MSDATDCGRRRLSTGIAGADDVLCGGLLPDLRGTLTGTPNWPDEEH